MDYKISLSRLTKFVGVDRLAARRLLQRHLDVIPDKEGYISKEDAKYYVQYVIDTNPGGDQRNRAIELLRNIDKSEWLIAMGLSAEPDPTIDDAEIDKTQDTPEKNPFEEEEKIHNFEKPTQMETKKHVGIRILMDPWTAMFFTFFALLGQAYLFAHLAHRVFEGINIPAPFWFHYGIAIIFESTGILIASNFSNRKIGDEISARGLWLFAFFMIQVVSDLCLFNVIANKTVGIVIISLAMPVALLGYANLYMEENKK